MNVLGSGFIPILIYSSFSEAVAQDDTILTENNFDLLTEASQEILREF